MAQHPSLFVKQVRLDVFQKHPQRQALYEGRDVDLSGMRGLVRHDKKVSFS